MDPFEPRYLRQQAQIFLTDYLSCPDNRFEARVVSLQSTLRDAASCMAGYVQDIRYAQQHAPKELAELRMHIRHQLPDVVAELLEVYLRKNEPSS